MTCREVSLTPTPGWHLEAGAWRCQLPGHRVALACVAGRPDAVGGPYCDGHGGSARAHEEAEREWNWLAPECVGDAAAVQTAGLLSLDTRHAYVVVRPERDYWLAWTGLGSHLEQIGRPGYDGCGRARCRSCRTGNGCGRGRHKFSDRDVALSVATTVWRERVRLRIAEIHAARGDTLSWGLPVTPLADPIVVELAENENAWDVAVTLERIGSAGLSMISGLRGTGEAR